MKPVLIVEDNPEVRETFAELLTLEGLPVATAANGEEGLASARHERPSVVFLDLKMPIIDGVSFILLARHDAALADIPIVVITADRTEAIPNGVSVIRKPCSFDQLIKVARTYGRSTRADC